ncbi:UNVERIFIED_CONTAM: hypothetical protein Sangu_1615400 [Sesamum angustifolium]|uniref:Uncharacterized protein n=1 Tax=Sesamum angustifolium TaxID=2727405 RepID=A0AAW2MIW4_9LAMI
MGLFWFALLGYLLSPLPAVKDRLGPSEARRRRPALAEPVSWSQRLCLPSGSQISFRPDLRDLPGMLAVETWLALPFAYRWRPLHMCERGRACSWSSACRALRCA